MKAKNISIINILSIFCYFIILSEMCCASDNSGFDLENPFFHAPDSRFIAPNKRQNMDGEDRIVKLEGVDVVVSFFREYAIDKLHQFIRITKILGGDNLDKNSLERIFNKKSKEVINNSSFDKLLNGNSVDEGAIIWKVFTGNFVYFCGETKIELGDFFKEWSKMSKVTPTVETEKHQN